MEKDENYEDFDITKHMVRCEIKTNMWLSFQDRPNYPEQYIPSKRELETPWYRRFENNRKNNKKR